jgi:hypothetical protein
MARRRSRRAHNWQPKGSTTDRGYGWDHQTERRHWDVAVQAGHARCVRCGLPIIPGTPYHLDHRDDRLGYLGVSHARCNLAAAGRRGNETQRAKRELEWLWNSPRVASREW